MSLGWENTNYEDADTESPMQVGKNSHPISTITLSQQRKGLEYSPIGLHTGLYAGPYQNRSVYGGPKGIRY